MRGNNINNYIEQGFGIFKDIIFAQTQACNIIQVFQFITMSMEKFYTRWLLAIANNHPGHLRILRQFLCPGWEKVNTDFIQKSTISNEFFVPSIQNNEFFYIVNSKIGVCTCLVGMNGAPCKHQGAVVMKFHISMFNFIPSLMANDRKIYSYIALGCVAKNNSFYASLRAGPIPQDQESNSLFINNGTEWKKLEENREPEKETNEINDNSAIDTILEEIRVDYENGGPHLRTALDKFAERYTAAKSKSIPKLCSFLYDLNKDLDQVSSGSMIRVQVESIRRRKTEKSGSKKRELLEEKENLDLQIIPSRKKKKTGKKEHNLSLHIAENRTN
ncbi:hypothetical protein GLOIN_2v1883854 [Rhizophagus clarus]|uniref:SWIM-type domain-containing protein n=1 Tax=Rhizophagus clarus TaxID=94130 RepID=A0A8H3QM48_9GLOM|nr:hypothetical protein GLOIN_2v1883854 [Rhizophagus clarus]